MSFLAPLFLLGALAVAAPIVLHLIRRTSRDKLPFSSLMFLQPSPPRVTRSSRIENLWLLLLRCLILLLLALGFARPLLHRPVAATNPADARQRVLLLIDDSASMRRENLWDEARARAETVLRQLDPNDAVAIFTFDRGARPLLSFEEWQSTPPGTRTAVAMQRLSASAPGWAATHLGPSLLGAVDAMQENERGTATGAFAGPKRIILLTDLQDGARLDGLQGYDWPRGLTVELELLKPRQPGNAGLQLQPEPDDTPGPAAVAGLKVRVSNASDSKPENFQLEWQRRPDGLAAGAPIAINVPRGQSRVVTVPRPPEQSGGGTIRLTGDGASFDNLLHTVTPRPQRIPVAYLGNDDPRDPARPLYYLRRAFQETRQKAVDLTVHRLDAPATATPIAAASMLIAAGPLSGESLEVARRFLGAGKPVLLALDAATTAATAAELAGLAKPSADEAASSGSYALLGQIDFTHPLFVPFADPRFSDFTKIHFWKHRHLDVSQWRNARVLARFDQGDPALLEMPAGRGTLFVLTSGWHPADSQLALSSKFVPLLYSLLDLGSPAGSPAAQHLIGDRIHLIASNQTEQVTVRKPDGTAVAVKVGGEFSGTDQPGIYTVGTGPAAWQFVVNLDPAESRTAPLDPGELERLQLPLRFKAPLEAAREEKRLRHLQAADLEHRQKLWRWLIAAAVVAVLLETWASGWLTRRRLRTAEADVPSL